MPGYAQEFPTFLPAMRLVVGITQELNPTVTTSFAHNYITGMIARLWVPRGYGMVQVNQQFAPITVTGDTTFTIALDTTGYDAFVIPPDYVQSILNQAPMVTPVGEVTHTLLSATHNQLPFSWSV